MHREILLKADFWIPALAAALVVFSVFLYRRTAPPLPVRRRMLLGALRVACFILLVLLLVNPVIVSKRTETLPPHVLVLLDRSRSMGTRDSAGRSRLESALEDAKALRSRLEAAGAEVAVLPFALDIGAGPLGPDSALTADGDGTDIRGALDAAADRYRSAGVAAMVLLSDGRVTRGMVSAGRTMPVPVHAVGYGDTARSADVSIEEIVADRTGYRGTVLPVEAVVRAVGLRGRAVEVRLLEDGTAKQSTTLAVRRDFELLSASFDYLPEREGTRRLTVEAIPAAPERDRDNNRESIRVDVRKDKIRILYIDQLADWNTTFFRDLVRRSKRLEADIVLWTPREGFVVDPAQRAWTFPAAAGALRRYDLVVVSDDARLFDTRANADALGRYVEEGGSVLFLADENSPLARSGSFEIIESLLPVRRMRMPRAEYAESAVRIAAEAAGDPLAAMLGAESALEAMPPLPGRIAGIAADAGARVPLVLRDREGERPFLAVGRRGEGLSGAVLGFPLWRWRLAGDEGRRIYESLLGGIVQYLAEGGKTPALAVDADRTVYRSGDPVRLTVSMGERREPQAVRGELRRKGDGGASLVGTVLFEPDAKRRGLYRAVLRGLAQGEYTATASEVVSGSGGASGSVDFSVVALSVEFLDTSRDGAFLARVAEETGGEYLEAAQLGSLAPKLDFAERKVERRSSRELRGNIAVLVAIVAILGAEWIARKAWGLV